MTRTPILADGSSEVALQVEELASLVNRQPFQEDAESALSSGLMRPGEAGCIGGSGGSLRALRAGIGLRCRSQYREPAAGCAMRKSDAKSRCRSKKRPEIANRSDRMNGMVDQPLADAISVFAEVLLINVILSGDNAIVVGTAVVGLPPAERLRALWLGIAAATILRVVFAAVATTLLRILGLVLAGGILLLWVAWKLWRDVARASGREQAAARLEGQAGLPVGRTKTFGQALSQIIVADVSMSLDNVLAVAGAAIEHPVILVLGLAISVLLMGAAAAAVARLLERYRWIAYVGLLVIVYVALKMIWAGAHEIVSTVG